jgi:hypothetical protein
MVCADRLVLSVSDSLSGDRIMWSILVLLQLEQLSISMHGSEKALVLKEKFMTEVSRMLLSSTIFHQVHLHFTRNG